MDVGVAVFGGGEFGVTVGAGVGWHGDGMAEGMKTKVRWSVKGEFRST